MTRLINSPAWLALEDYIEQNSEQHMRDLFAEQPERAKKYSLKVASLFLDYSKNRITDKTLGLLFDLARHCQLEQQRDAMFAGDVINHTEKRAVLHTALRAPDDGTDVSQQVQAELKRLGQFVEQVRTGQWQGYTGKRINHIVNIGIGGSDLGPKMVVQALKSKQSDQLNFTFVSNIDPNAIHHTLADVDPETTLFIVSSKSFTTIETLTNAAAARHWFLQQATQADVARHFVAVTTNHDKASEFGIDRQYHFAMWDWVGGRYSLWSAIGLPIMLSIGMTAFKALLEGAHTMDKHFKTAPLEQNAPVILGMLGILYNNFYLCETHAVLPYDEQLEYLPAYLQQADMESNGKAVDRDGHYVDYSTGPILWGATGTNGQHAFFQLIHQGTKMIPSDFIIARQTQTPYQEQHQILMANWLAQMEALMTGKTESEAQQGLTGDQQFLTPYKVFEGNQPTNAIVLEQLDPFNLGLLIALYEHKIFVQGAIWNLNSFDQWGVEYGKQLATQALTELQGQSDSAEHDSSTQQLLAHLRNTN